jgi:hypothetical protein
MELYRRLLVVTGIAILGLLLCSPANAAEQPTEMAPQVQTPSATPAPAPASAADDAWHFSLSPYLWFPGVHGTVGANGHDASVHASAGDLLSHFRFGLMATAELRRKRFLIPVDMMWVRLGDDKALPFLGDGVSADIKVDEFILTPKIGYRLLDGEKLKIDALTGFRYWHLGQNLKFNPSITGRDFSGSQNWVDPLVGGRITAPLSPKIEALIAGDVGGWGAGSQLDYQIVGLLGYRLKTKYILQVGYRYLDVDWRSGGNVFDTATSGFLFGVTINFK